MLDIIIVEDNKEIGTLLSDFLRKENYVVSIAENGEKALELFERYGAKLIILDLMLPGMDGFSVCSKIRESSNAHILIASAKTAKEDKLKGLNLGADDYIEKPYDIDILLANMSYVEDNLLDNSSYKFSSNFSKTNIYNAKQESYYQVVNSYRRVIDLVNIVSDHYVTKESDK